MGTAPGPPRVDSQLMPATTELPSADPPPSKLPTEMPPEPRDHAITPRTSPTPTAPGLLLVDSALMTAPTELPSADPKPRRTPTLTPPEPRDHATQPSLCEQLDCF